MREFPTTRLGDGTTIPQLGVGLSRISDHTVEDVLVAAFSAGYRYIDTAETYRNAVGVGHAIDEASLPRDELFVSARLSGEHHDHDEVVQALDLMFDRLETDYVDLLLLPWTAEPAASAPDVWRAVLDAREAGRVRSLGVAQMDEEGLDVLARWDVLPAMNQLRVHPSQARTSLVASCHERGIAVGAATPFRHGADLELTVVREVADDVGRTPAQVVLRWHVQRGHVPVPEAVRATWIWENAEIFDFTLDDEAMARLAKADGMRTDEDLPG